MEINGRKLQEKLLQGLSNKIEILKKSGVAPGIAIVTLGPEETWEAYVNQKIKLAKILKINYKLVNLRPKNTEDVLKAIDVLNNDNTINGLIVQRPFPTYIDIERVIQNVSKDKDIDGFRNDSKFDVPVWLAVNFILTHISRLLNEPDYHNWLSNQSILVIGKGETAGNPVIKGLTNLKIKTSVMDRRTKDRVNLFEKANIIIFATGKRIEIPYNRLKKNCILIGVGLHRKDGILEGDFDQNEAKDNVLYYTPSPGGVGPLNLYFLFENLIKAAKLSLDKKRDLS